MKQTGCKEVVQLGKMGEHVKSNMHKCELVKEEVSSCPWYSDSLLESNFATNSSSPLYMDHKIEVITFIAVEYFIRCF